MKACVRFGISLAIIIWMAVGEATAATEVTKVRIGVHPQKTRLVLETTKAFPYQIFLLGNPYRVVIDLPDVSWRAPLRQMKEPVGFVANYRFGLFKPGNNRVVVDVTRPVRVARHAILDGGSEGNTRFFLDLEPVTQQAFNQVRAKVHSRQWAAPKVPKSLDSEPPARTRRSDGRRVVVIDPGHGGVDPGAIGISGTFESHVALKAAHMVKRTLESSGRYIAMLTRSRDIYIPLRERSRKAEKVGAELFISLHADSINNPKIRGASVYTLSEKASDKEAEALAAKENRSDIIAGVDLTQQSDPVVVDILISMRQRRTKDESAHFARFMVDNLGKSVRLLRNTHRFAGFAVLKSLDVPSVLVELGYLSNRTDEKLLKTKKYRTKISKAILRATDAYFERKERLSKS